MILILLILATGCTGLPAATVLASSESVPSPRIICLSSDAAELLVIIGAGDHVIGVPDSLIRNQPELLPFLPNAESVGDAKRPDNERILSLHPDMVMFISAMRPATAGSWEAAGIRAMPLESHKAEDLPEVARMLGDLTGQTEKAERYALFWEETMALIESRISRDAGPGPRIYMESYTDYVAYGNVSAADSVIRMMNGRSISGEIFFNATRISAEWICQQDPEVIIKSSIPKDGINLEGEYDRLVKRPGFKDLSAVRDERVFVVNGNLIFSPHAPVGTLYLAKALYPDRFFDVDPDAIMQEYTLIFLDAAEEQTPIYPVPWQTEQTDLRSNWS
jgi:iron complex transport system substrate-binding protein